MKIYTEFNLAISGSDWLNSVESNISEFFYFSIQLYKLTLRESKKYNNKWNLTLPKLQLAEIAKFKFQ